jgi:hypothetical protein
MTEDRHKEVVITYLKQLRMMRMARDCESVAREAEQRGLGYLGYEAPPARGRVGSAP